MDNKWTAPEETVLKPRRKESKKCDVSPIGTIIEVVAIKEIKNPSLVGPADAMEYCEKYNLYYTASEEGERWFVDIYSECKELHFCYSFEDQLSLFDTSNPSRPIGNARCYKNYKDIVRDRHDPEYRDRGILLDTDHLQFIRIMPPRTVTVGKITETL